MSTAHTPELLPCPFCGGEATLTRGILTYVGCKKCVIAFGRHPDLKDSEERTITEWNTRAPSPVNAALPQWTKGLPNESGIYWWWSERNRMVMQPSYRLSYEQVASIRSTRQFKLKERERQNRYNALKNPAWNFIVRP